MSLGNHSVREMYGAFGCNCVVYECMLIDICTRLTSSVVLLTFCTSGAFFMIIISRYSFVIIVSIIILSQCKRKMFEGIIYKMWEGNSGIKINSYLEEK